MTRAFDLRPSLRSFTAPLVLGVSLGLGVSGCTAPPSRGDHAEGDAENQKKDKKKGGGEETAGGDDQTDKTKSRGKSDVKAAAKDRKRKPAEPPADDGCCKYCPEGESPCGEACIAAGATCDDKGASCACEWSKRPAPTYKKGDQVLSGLIRSDVPAYNAAQEDPIAGFFTLEQAFEGAPELADKAAGKLWATIETSKGAIECELYEEWAPLTVANFVGLARGKRPWRDPKDQRWKTDPYFDGVIFHRVIENFMIQGGDKLGTGIGSTGFFVPDEFHPKARHDAAGILSMANRNRIDPRTNTLNVDPKTGQSVGNTGSAQFFITVTPTPQLDDRHSVFGKCQAKVPIAISKIETITNRAQRLDHKPKEDVTIDRISFARKK
jgi:cyclophilin family peptidyl-prolyl cis-trans isomerase